MKIAFVVNDVHTELASYTTTRLAMAAVNMGHKSYTFGVGDFICAAEKVTPPLSVGVFGDWGSGKSFFMRLMQEQTKQVAASSATDANGDRLFCRQIVSIRFNAWHYADGNLWASLVQTIFQSLRAALARFDQARAVARVNRSELMPRFDFNPEAKRERFSRTQDPDFGIENATTLREGSSRESWVTRRVPLSSRPAKHPCNKRTPS